MKPSQRQKKAAQKQAVATEADNAKQAIDKGQNADAVDKAKTDGIKAIDAQHQSGQAIKARQNDAKQAIDAEAAKVTKAIDQDPTLTAAEKKAQKQAVTDAATKAKAAIDAALVADAIDQALADGIKTIDAQHQSGIALDKQKAVANKQLMPKRPRLVKRLIRMSL